MKKSTNQLLAMSLFSLLLLGLTACESGIEKQGGQTTEHSAAVQGSQSTAHAPITNQPASATGKEWPAEIPSAAPRFEFGSLDDVLTNDTPENLTWVLKYSGTTENDVVGYEAILAAAGFKPERMNMGNKGAMIIGAKDKLTVTMNYTATNVTVGVNKAKQ